jgi:hypothetical protein
LTTRADHASIDRMTAPSPPTLPPLARTLAWNGAAFLAMGALARWWLGQPDVGLGFLMMGALMVPAGLVWMAVGAVRARRRQGGDPG